VSAAPGGHTTCSTTLVPVPYSVKPRLQQDTCCPAICVPDEQLVSGYIIMLTDTCCRIQVARSGYMLTVSRRITIHLCHGRLAFLYIQQQTGDNFVVADTRNMLTVTSVLSTLDWCKRGLTHLCHTTTEETPASATTTIWHL